MAQRVITTKFLCQWKKVDIYEAQEGAAKQGGSIGADVGRGFPGPGGSQDKEEEEEEDEG